MTDSVSTPFLYIGDTAYLQSLTSLQRETLFTPGRERIETKHPWSVQYPASLPHYDLIIKSVATACSVFQNELATLELETPPIVFCMPYYGKSGDCSCITFDDPSDPQRTAVCVTLDLRLIYELYALTLCSPLGQLEADERVAAAMMKSCLATRLHALGDPDLIRFVAALASESVHYPRRDDPMEPLMHSIQELESSSWLEAEALARTIKRITSFLVFHEFGHALLTVSPGRREALFHNIRGVAQMFTAHKREGHDDDLPGGVRASMEAIAEYEAFDSIDEEIQTKIDSSARVITRMEIEEWMCDQYALQHSCLPDGMLATSPTTHDDVSVWLGMPYLLQKLGYLSTTVVGTIRHMAQVYDHTRFTTPTMISDEDQELIASGFKLESQYTAIRILRSKLVEGGMYGVYALLEQERQKHTAEEESRSRSRYPSSLEHKVWTTYSIALQKRLIDEVFSIEGYRRLSSKGRAISLLVPSGLNSGAGPFDPFSLYYLGACEGHRPRHATTN